MDKNFIENCKLLKRHFTKLTQADTTAQSNYAGDKAKDIINEAKMLLLTEQIEELSNEDIARLKEKSDNKKYAEELQKYKSKQSYRTCKKENISWDNEIFLSPLPHPKNNSDYLKFHKIDTNTETDNERKEIEEIANIILNKYDSIEKVDNSNTKKNSQEMKIKIVQKIEETKPTNKEEINIPTNKEEKNMKQEDKIEKKVNFEVETDENKPTSNEIMVENSRKEEFFKERIKLHEFRTEQVQNIIEEKCEQITDIPELKVTPQKNKKVEFLEIKKINIEEKENTEDFDTKEIEDDKNKEMLTNTLVKWKTYTKQNKNTKINAHNKKIDSFLDNLKKFQNANKSKSDLTDANSQNPKVTVTKIKPKSSTIIETKMSSYEYRFKAQKDIIEMQKQKLEEQNKLIEQLKLNKIQKDARDSLEKASELKKSILSSSKHKYKLKSDKKQEINEPETNENELNFSLNFNKAPKIVKMMEERARERHEKRLLIQERKRLLEEEKKRQAEELVQRKLKEETEEKQKRIERMKKQREHVRQMELKKQLEKKRYIELNDKAIELYKTNLKKSGFKTFKMLIYNVKINTEIAKRFYENNIVINCFKSWRNLSSKIIEKKNKLATDLYTKKLLEKMMSCWKRYNFEAIQCKQVAIDRYEMSLQSKCFIEWHKLICEYRVQYTVNAQKADRYYRRALLYHCFEKWRSLPAIMQIERVQNERKRKWRLRVAEILSDYDPLKNYDINY